MKKTLAACGLLLLTHAACAGLSLSFEREVLAKAQPDEWFYGQGHPSNTYVDAGIDLDHPPSTHARPKVNQAHVWGLTRSGDTLWFGTGPNIRALLAGTYMGHTDVVHRATHVHEYGESRLAKAGVVPPELGDWRVPDIFACDLNTGSPTNLDASLPPYATNLLHHTQGLRSAGASASNAVHSEGVVILAGPSLTATNGGGIVAFAFDAATKDLIDARRLTDYANIRKWKLHDGVLYTTVTLNDGDGQVLRWINDPEDPDYPLAFENVGNLDNGGAELCVHENRLFVGTWPGILGQKEFTQEDLPEIEQESPGLWMSRTIPDQGLKKKHRDQWYKVWNVYDYEIDLVTGAVYGVGAMASFGDYLFWGTVHVPGLGDFAHTKVYGAPTNAVEAQRQFENSERSLMIFRGSNFDQGFPPFSDPDMDAELLYGCEQLAWRDIYRHPKKNWRTNENALGTAPLFGESGFGNAGNRYAWTMGVYQEQLYVGTMDFPGLTEDGQPGDAQPYEGAELYCFPTPTNPAAKVSGEGVGNYSNYGIRTMRVDSNSLYLGMANPFNLMTDPDDDQPDGGWELVRLTRTFDDGDWDDMPDDWEAAYFGGSTNAAPDGDGDGDGFDNRAEFIAATDPGRGDDFPAIHGFNRASDTEVRLTWNAHTGRVYRVYASDSMNGPWREVYRGQPEEGVVDFSHNPSNRPAAFYKLGVSLPNR
ncbi:hypothetical protein [Kiritimatiella glycovorans]|uniref:Uncharacterized protein n=1 Tax=Kiritimatiella glycovorans TaxID=1307763 RepID=A0A0G3EFJ2_9BACT|nr:hypothetical protein [Kiritimatiella glycovorans]AKJ65118.1 hypothetical protein L21SP4_01882 [Kiritimatiella glycovorans]